MLQWYDKTSRHQPLVRRRTGVGVDPARRAAARPGGSVRVAQPDAPSPTSTCGVSGWMWVVPVLVVLNGLSPFLELRTAYAFNMYANLETAAGESNHFLVPRTLPLTDYQGDLVRCCTRRTRACSCTPRRGSTSRSSSSATTSAGTRTCRCSTAATAWSTSWRERPTIRRWSNRCRLAVEAVRLPLRRPDRAQPLPTELPARPLKRMSVRLPGAMAGRQSTPEFGPTCGFTVTPPP